MYEKVFVSADWTGIPSCYNSTSLQQNFSDWHLSRIYGRQVANAGCKQHQICVNGALGWTSKAVATLFKLMKHVHKRTLSSSKFTHNAGFPRFPWCNPAFVIASIRLPDECVSVGETVRCKQTLQKLIFKISALPPNCSWVPALLLHSQNSGISLQKILFLPMICTIKLFVWQLAQARCSWQLRYISASTSVR